MTKFVGRRGKLGLAIETVRGTAISPTFWVPFATMSFKDTIEQARETQGMGVIADGDSKYVIMKMGEGDVQSEIYDKAMGVVLTSLLGASPSSSGSGTYTHQFTLSNSNQHKSLSLYWKDPDRSYMFPLAMLDTLKISIEPKGMVEYTLSFKSKTARDWTIQTSDYTGLGSKFLHQHLQFRLASNIVGLSAATPISLKKLELTFNKNTAYDDVMGTVEPEDILNQQLGIEGTLELNLEDDTYRNYMLNGTYRSMEVKLINGASSSLTMQFPRVDFSAWEPDFTLANIAKQKINIKCNYDAANALDIISTCTLVNQQVSY
jgi:hypothetical protein